MPPENVEIDVEPKVGFVMLWEVLVTNLSRTNTVLMGLILVGSSILVGATQEQAVATTKALVAGKDITTESTSDDIAQVWCC